MVRTGLAVAGAALVLIGGGVLSWGPFSGSPEARATQLGGIDSVELVGGRGDVEVRLAPGGAARVEERPSSRWFGADQDGFTHRVEGGKLLLDGDCGWNCAVDYVVTLPAAVPIEGDLGSGSLGVVGMSSVEAEVGSGAVSVRDVAGQVRVRTGSGSIELAELGGDLDVRTGSGEIEGSGILGRDVDARTTSGDIELRLLDPGKLEAETGSGEIALSVPSDEYRVDADTGSGDTEIDVAQDANAARELSLSSGSGDIRVETAP